MFSVVSCRLQRVESGGDDPDHLRRDGLFLVQRLLDLLLIVLRPRRLTTPLRHLNDGPSPACSIQLCHRYLQIRDVFLTRNTRKLCLLQNFIVRRRHPQDECVDS